MFNVIFDILHSAVSLTVAPRLSTFEMKIYSFPCWRDVFVNHPYIYILSAAAVFLFYFQHHMYIGKMYLYKNSLICMIVIQLIARYLIDQALQQSRFKERIVDITVAWRVPTIQWYIVQYLYMEKYIWRIHPDLDLDSFLETKSQPKSDRYKFRPVVNSNFCAIK